MSKPKEYITKQIAPHVLMFQHANTKRCHFRVMFARNCKQMTRYVYTKDSSEAETTRAKTIALRLAKRIAADLTDPLSEDDIEKLFDLYKNADLGLIEDNETK